MIYTQKKIKCVSCGQELIVDNFIANSVCICGKLKISNNIVIEGDFGKDWVDVTPRLLNE